MSRFLWTPKESFGPSPRASHAMAFDSNRGRTVLFGGNPYGATLLGDTWEWDGELWTQTSEIGPEPRSDHAMAFDSTRNVVLLFGGNPGPQVLADTWSWDGTDWTQLADTGPSAREGHSMVFDTARGRAVLFGGIAIASYVNDTWEWDGQQWTQQENIGPTARGGHAMAFDLVGKHTVLFGGNDLNGQCLGDTWEWDGALWTNTANFGPNPRSGAALVSTDVQIALYGGVASMVPMPASAPNIFHDTWAYRSKRWTHLQDIGPGPRYSHATAFDIARRSIVLFGGLAVFNPPANDVPAGQILGDTWEHAETDPPLISTPSVAAVLLVPSSTTQGSAVTATVTISQPAPAGGIMLIMGYTPMGVFQTLMTNPATITSNQSTVLGQLTVVAGATTGQFVFSAPASQPPVAIVVYSAAGGLMAYATLTIP